MRFTGSLFLALLISLGLFWLMQWLISPPEGAEDKPDEPAAVQVFRIDEPPPPKSEQSAANAGGGSAAPPDPPPVPGVDRPSGIAIPAPKVDSDVVLPKLEFKAEFSSKTGLGESFGGFAAGGSGGGGGSGSGFGSGSGAGTGGGPDMVPLSTARPQIPEEACNRNIEGYAVAKFNVTPRGKVTNVRIVDADPRGLFERPMVESLENWLYQSNSKGKAYDVAWRFDFKLKDCKLNWN